jgi:4'-phosphopantetheinyl transferase
MKDERREHLDGNVVVWMAEVSASRDALRFLEPYLDAQDRERAARFHFAEDRARYVLGRALVRNILGRYWSQTPETIELASTERGQLYFSDDEAMRFSITHAHNLVAVALTANARVGIDIEYMERKLNLEGLGERILSAEDFRVFQVLPDRVMVPTFFRIWTRKEAYLKGTGEGITDALKEITVSMHTEEIGTISDARDEADAKKWRMHSLALPENYLGCVACDDAAKRVDFRPVRFDGGEVIEEATRP